VIRLKGLSNRAAVILLVTLIFLLATTFSAGAKEPVGTIVTLEKTVEIKPAGAKEWKILKLKDNVHVEDTIRTGEDSRVKMFFVDDSTISLGPITTLRIDEHLFKPAESYRDSKFKLFLGKARVQVRGFFSKDSKYEVHTPTAVAGVKGTRFTVWVKSPTMTTIGVTQGQVSVRNVSPAIVGEQILTRNLATDVPISKPPQTPKHMDKQQINNLQKDTLAKGKVEGAVTKERGAKEEGAEGKMVGKEGGKRKGAAGAPPTGPPKATGRGAGEAFPKRRIQTKVVDVPPEHSIQRVSREQRRIVRKRRRRIHPENGNEGSQTNEGEEDGEGGCQTD